MKNFKLSRDLWLLAGACFLVSTILQLESKFILIPILNGVTCILSFVNAYVNHEKNIRD